MQLRVVRGAARHRPHQAVARQDALPCERWRRRRWWPQRVLLCCGRVDAGESCLASGGRAAALPAAGRATTTAAITTIAGGTDTDTDTDTQAAAAAAAVTAAAAAAATALDAGADQSCQHAGAPTLALGASSATDPGGHDRARAPQPTNATGLRRTPSSATWQPELEAGPSTPGPQHKSIGTENAAGVSIDLG
eukprot:COSAG01_NODE_2015_length_8643_cov_8.718984_4_plen_193_part_00